MDSNFYDPQSLFISQEEFNFESLLSDELGSQSPSLTGDEDQLIFDSPVTSPDPISFELSPPHGSDLIPVEVKQEYFPPPMTISPPFPTTLSLPVTIPPSTILIKELDEEEDDQCKRGTKRTRKRRKISSPKKVSVTNDKNTITLTREELLSISSEQFEDFVSQVTDNRELTTGEKNELKRQRRLIKNRESAHASRQRKKSHIDELERRVKELTSENSILKENVSLLSNENSQLKNEVVFLQAVVNKTGVTNLLGCGVNSFLNSLGGKQNQLQPNVSNIVLMIVLISFGLFFHFGMPGQKPVFPTMEPLPEVINSRVFHHEDYEPTSQSKDFLNVLAEQEVPVHRLEQAYRRHLARDSTKEINIPRPEFYVETHKPQEPSLVQLQTSPVVVESSNSTVLPSMEVSGVSQPQTEKESQTVSPLMEVSVVSKPQIQYWKSNTTYLLCENVSQMIPPAHVLQSLQEDTENPPMISFLIPPDVLGGVTGGITPMEGLNSTVEDMKTVSPDWNFKGYLEVTCQVLDMNFLANDQTPVC